MLSFSDQIINDSGYRRPIEGADVYLLKADGTLASAFAPNPQKTDGFGAFTFTAPSGNDGVYNFEARVGGVTIAKGQQIIGNAPEFTGPTGPANSTYTSLAALKQAPTTNKSYTLVVDGGRTEYAYVTGDFTGRADDLNVVKLDAVPLSTGALVRQSAAAVSFTQAGAGAVPRDTQTKARERVSVSDYRQPGDIDDTAAFLRARDYCQQTGKTLWVPAGSYTISDTIGVSGSFDVRGEGAERSLITMVSATAKPMFDVAPANNTVVLGMWFSGMQLRCSGGSAVCDGVIVRSAPVNSTIRQCQFDNLWIRDCRRGFSLQGVIYRNFITNITVQGTTEHGFYCDAGFVDVTYNTFAQLEVTNVADGAHAYYLHSNNSLFDMLTSDGVAYFSSPGGVLRNYKLETIQANSYPVSVGPACVLLNQMQVVDGASCIGVLPSKRTYFLRIIGSSTSIRATRFVSPQPINPYFFESGSAGTIDGTYMEGVRGTDKRFVEDSHPDDILNRWMFSACEDITMRSARRQQGVWTPNFSAEWTTPPTGVAGTWRRSGDKVLYIATGTGGVCTAGASIGGLPQIGGAPLHMTRGNGQLVSPTQASPCLISDPSETTLRSFRVLNIPSADEWTLVVEAGA